MDITHNSLLYMTKFIDRYPEEKQGELADEQYLELLNIWQQNFAPDMKIKFEEINEKTPETRLELDLFANRFFRTYEFTDSNFERYSEIVNKERLEAKKDTIARDMGYTVDE